MTKISHIRGSLGLLALTAVVVLLLSACQTVPKSAPAGLTQAEFFQRAQEAADTDNWKAALFYYKTFKERYPKDTANIAAADYEIAFIHYRTGDYKEAKTGFEDLLARYQGKDANTLPQWAEVLSRMILKEVDTHLGVDPKTDPGLEAAQNAPASTAKTGLPTGATGN